MNPLRLLLLALSITLARPALTDGSAPARPPVATDLEGGELPAAPGSNPISRGNFTADPAPLVVASMIPPEGWEQISVETVTGPWTYRGRVTGSSKNSFTIHPGIV